jgi:LacI family transcriptional regulator
MHKHTLESVAELSGVSRSTVSRVINDQPGVKPEVRRRVWEIIEQTGFQPNQAARTLASSRSGIIGLVIPHVVSSLFGDPYFPRLIQGITQACNRHDLNLTLFVFHTEEEEGSLHRRILNTGFLDGLIIASSHFQDPLIPHLLSTGLPFVVIGRQDRFPEASFVDVDNLNGAYAATSHLLRQGRQRVATITGPQDMVAGVDRLQGYRQALSQKSHGFDPALVAEGDFTEESGYAAMIQLLPARPDAVFVASDMMALGALRAIEAAGLNVPGDIAVAGFDDILPPDAARPPLTTIRQPIRRSGVAAVNVLLDVIENGLTPPRRVILDVQLVIRESCGGM